jgi:hypothetical protein
MVSCSFWYGYLKVIELQDRKQKATSLFSICYLTVTFDINKGQFLATNLDPSGRERGPSQSILLYQQAIAVVCSARIPHTAPVDTGILSNHFPIIVSGKRLSGVFFQYPPGHCNGKPRWDDYRVW